RPVIWRTRARRPFSRPLAVPTSASRSSWKPSSRSSIKSERPRARRGPPRPSRSTRHVDRRSVAPYLRGSLTKARSPWSVLFLLLVAVVSAPTRVLARNQPDAAPSPADPVPGTSSVAALVKQGNEARRAGQMRVAIASFRKARDLAPHTYEIRILLADAQRLFEEILKARPQEAPARAGLARVAEDRGDLAGAIRAWDAYLEIKTEDEAAELRRQELRELRASIEALRETAGRAASAGVLAELGRLQSVAGDAQGAVESYRRALRVDAEHVEARRGLARALP